MSQCRWLQARQVRMEGIQYDPHTSVHDEAVAGGSAERDCPEAGQRLETTPLPDSRSGMFQRTRLPVVQESVWVPHTIILPCRCWRVAVIL